MAVAQWLRLMVQLVEILVFVTLEAIFSNREGLPTLEVLSNHLLNIRAVKNQTHPSCPPTNTRTHAHTDSGAPMSSHSLLWCSYLASAAKQRGSAYRPARLGRSTEPEPAESSPHARLGYRVTDGCHLTTTLLHGHIASHDIVRVYVKSVSPLPCRLNNLAGEPIATRRLEQAPTPHPA